MKKKRKKPKQPQENWILIKQHEDTDSHLNQIFFYGENEGSGIRAATIKGPIQEHVSKRILGWNYDTNQKMISEITSTDIVTKNQWIKIHMKLSKDDIVSEIATTSDTKVLLFSEAGADDKWSLVSDLKVGDLLMAIPSRNRLSKLITNIEIIEETKKFVKINTDSNSEYVCNGIWLKDY